MGFNIVCGEGRGSSRPERSAFISQNDAELVPRIRTWFLLRAVLALTQSKQALESSKKNTGRCSLQAK